MQEQIRRLSTFDDSRLAEYLSTEPLNVLHTLKLYLDDKYYNTDADSGLTDQQYDMLKDILTQRDPDYKVPVGARIRQSENRAKLPFWLGSMDKMMASSVRFLFFKEQEKILSQDFKNKEEMRDAIDDLWLGLSESEQKEYQNIADKELQKELNAWISKNPSDDYVVEYKLDGVSCLLVINKGKIKLYTRGDGVIGADISYLAQYFDSIPRNKDLTITVRGELIMKNDVFEKKYAKEYANPRNMVAGRIGGKTVRKGLSDIEFIAYEIVGDEEMPQPSEQLCILESQGFKVVYSKTMKKPTVKSLTETYKKFKETSDYQIDGVIVQQNSKYFRNKSGNPKYAFAFKVRSDDNMVNVEVSDVEWNVSQWGFLKPIVKFKPTLLNGVTIRKATAHNAKYILENNIGKGAIIRVTRSGDVIPYIAEVISAADEVGMPNSEYHWNETGVNIYTKDQKGIMDIKTISNFFSKMCIKHVSEATVKKLYSDGLVTLQDIVGASKERLMEVDTIKEKSANRIYENIRNGLSDVSLPVLLGSYGVFGYGMGRKRMTSLMTDIPDLLSKKRSEQDLRKIVSQVEGFSEKTTNNIVNNIDKARDLVDSLKAYMNLKKVAKKSDDMKGMTIVMSGFRDKKLEQDIVDRGGKVTTSVSGKTSALVVSDKDATSSKIAKAKEKGVIVYDKDEFLGKFF